MQNEFEFINEDIQTRQKQIEYYQKCIKNEMAALDYLIKKKNIMEYKITPGKLCWFWDYNEDQKRIRPMIRPYHHTEIREGRERHYSADLEGESIGHGWLFCRPVELSEIVGKIIS